MNPKNIVVIGVKGSALAFHRETGAHLWATELKSGGPSSDFVTLTSDETRVYAHTGGELFCLDLFTGAKLWQDGLKGFGYGLASIILPGNPPASPAAAELMRQAAASASSTTHTANSPH